MSPLGVYYLIALAGTVWVAFDARRFDWHGNGFCDRVWKWVVGCVFLFGIAFPAYLVQRRKVPVQGSILATATPTFSSHELGASGGGAAAVERAVAELGAYAPAAAKPPLLVSPPFASEARATPQGSVAVAVLAGAAVALAGGLLWAGIVIATRLDIGIVAWLVGAATGATVLRVLGGPVPVTTKVVAGLMAAAAIVVGKYVIFVHDVKKTIGPLLAQHGLSVGYLDTRQMGIFIHNFSTIVRPIYALWLLGAFVAAVRVARGKTPRPGRS